jgi:GTP cyclohydrolase IA
MNKKRISEQIKDRIIEDEGKFFANHNISKYIQEGEIELLVDEVAEKFEEVLKSLVIDIEHDHNTNDTARRVAKMYVKEIFSGRYQSDPDITAFPNVSKYDELYVVGPIAIHSTCSHHFQNIIGKAYIGIAPDEEVIGLSKFHRQIASIARRPQIQEELTVQIADKLCEITKTESIAVRIDAEHHCVACRGVMDESTMVTNVVRGKFREDKSLKQEFMQIVSDLKRNPQ